MSWTAFGEDIEIRFGGARPGEKLQGYLWTGSTNVTLTSFSHLVAWSSAKEVATMTVRDAATLVS